MTLSRLLTLCLFTLLPLTSLADDTTLSTLQQRWAEINYQVPARQRAEAFEKLAAQASTAVQAEPGSAELRIWHGIILSTWAGAKGGLGALGLVKDARRELERALEINPGALDGSAYTSLGSLYYQVPGWPVGFGDDEKAEQMLQQALMLNPDGIDPNYFYGDFLQRQHRYREAAGALEKALAAPERAGRTVADQGRREEARTLLASVQEKLD
ncbi:hypothetical protein S7S_07915 [Isoalcanivorax pacificus W11-5]|jgi:tetratricopeptide (TPR) repeat protein|uniref:Tetratricopeptide repeat protein n=1 Tax=Isoalcanivorax pacificus W11-5 TaxID=391936 RepID=A0A0B4XIF9_9GAMM|nr:hypothetical protein [Isoalcanivorax pacificus]AJD47999.1 hypothetical protein S7S_07915 [Isoalcanivorax pacificus W11-5]